MDPRVEELFCITPIANLASIRTQGILSHCRAEAVKHLSVADPVVQARRTVTGVPRGRAGGPQLAFRPLHEYANLYINPRNAMMYKLRARSLELCMLRVSLDVLRLPGVALTDRNASCDGVRFFAPNQWRNLVFDDILARDWRHPGNPPRYYQHRARVCAEVLVPDAVLPQYISGVIVANRAVQAQVHSIAPEWPVEINPDVFFWNGG